MDRQRRRARGVNLRRVFSHRLPWDRPENALAITEQARRAAGQPIVDLTVSNPTQVGLPYPEATLRQVFCDVDAAAYHPTPRGLFQARAAIAADQARRGLTVDPERLVVTASSSESYGLLFKLLCDPGDAVLVPEPSYPLFDYLARLEGIVPTAYQLAYDGAWHVDFASIEAALAEARRQGHPPRALIVVNPNNPTGSFLKRAEYLRLADLCAARGLAIIADEVFADYAWDRVSLGLTAGREPVGSVAAAADVSGAALTFSLGGLSKSCGLPQLKLGWIQVGGRAADVAAALTRLDLIADTYLSVGTPVQLAAPALLRLGAAIRTLIAARVTANRDLLRSLLPASSPCTLLPAEGGWSAILRVPAVQTDAQWADTLLQDDGILVQPGYFFDMPPGEFLVISLLPLPALFAPAMASVVARCSLPAEG
ncbi:MAG: hypothetical protein QOI66_2135 [Myxococcales bacterium]|nr:hypothetical protein [Myxococcales bacterium]